MKRLFLLLLPLVLPFGTLQAQDGNSPVTYSNLALQYNFSAINGDAANSFLPSTATANGFGSFKDNPAATALFEKSSFSFSLLNSSMDLQNSYHNNEINSDLNKTNLSQLGVVYKVPTQKGSFVIGGGYTLHANRMFENRLNTFNTQSTITDHFKDPGSQYYDLAFETYAIDYATVDESYLESIFRIDIDYPGITQDATESYSTNIGDYSVFFGTEFQKNLYVGVSLGVLSGSYSYNRNFLELDEENFYDGEFIPRHDDTTFTDIHSILVEDEIDAQILGFTMNAGFIYSLSNINFGISYSIPHRLHISESFYSSIETNLDEGNPYFYDLSGDFDYSILQPGKLNVGVALTDLYGFEISTAAEWIDYSSSELDLVSEVDLDYDEKRLLREDQEALNDEMAQNYNSVINLRAGLKYELQDVVEARLGYAFYPARSAKFDSDKNILSAGLGIHITRDIVLDLSAMYSFWDDQSVAYSYFDNSNQLVEEAVSHKVSRFNMLAGLKFNF